MADKITMGPDGKLRVPDEPIIPFIEGDGTGIDIWPAARRVIDAAVAKRGQGRSIAWTEVLAGDDACGNPARRISAFSCSWTHSRTS